MTCGAFIRKQCVHVQCYSGTVKVLSPVVLQPWVGIMWLVVSWFELVLLCCYMPKWLVCELVWLHEINAKIGYNLCYRAAWLNYNRSLCTK